MRMFRTRYDRKAIEGVGDVCTPVARPVSAGRHRDAVESKYPDRVADPIFLASQHVSEEDAARWARLTAKQRACLDLLLERKTSKEIARVVGVSKPTVDQRLTTARAVLGVDTRDQAAMEYARLKQIYDRVTYDPVHIPVAPQIVSSDFADGDASSVVALSDTADACGSIAKPAEGISGPLGLIGRHDHKGSARAVLMAAIVLFLLVVAHASLGISETLTRLVSD